MAEHELKCWPSYFEDVAAGRKRFEVRRNDRDFAVGDTLRLREWTPLNDYTGREVRAEVCYVLTSDDGVQFPAIKVGYAVLGIELADAPYSPHPSSGVIKAPAEAPLVTPAITPDAWDVVIDLWRDRVVIAREERDREIARADAAQAGAAKFERLAVAFDRLLFPGPDPYRTEKREPLINDIARIIDGRGWGGYSDEEADRLRRDLERLRAEARLGRAEAKYKALYERGSDGTSTGQLKDYVYRLGDASIERDRALAALRALDRPEEEQPHA